MRASGHQGIIRSNCERIIDPGTKTAACSAHILSLLALVGMEVGIIKRDWNRLDGPWSWVIVATAFLSMLMASGVALTTGIYYPVFLEVFKEGSGKTSTVSALTFAVMSAIGKLIACT